MDFVTTISQPNIILKSLKDLWDSTGLSGFNGDAKWTALKLVMMCLACFLLFLAIVKKFEPNLLLAIAFGMFLINIPGAYEVLYYDSTANAAAVAAGGTPSYGLFYYLYKGVEWVIFPPLIFLGIGAMTDFGPLIANPKSLILGAAAQVGIFIALIIALLTGIYSINEAASIGIIGGADGPTAIYVTQKLAPELLASIAIAAYSYMALVPVIQPPIMKLVTTKKERSIVMGQLRQVSRKEKIVFPIVVTGVVGILLPAAIPLVGMLMLGNLMKESGVVPRLANTSKNELINIITIFLGITVGSKAYAPNFLTVKTLVILFLGIFAFAMGTLSGLLIGKLMCKLSKGKINPLIGAAGVSAVPMAARVAQDVGKKENPNNYLLMHAMGPNVAGVIGSAVAAGVLLAVLG